MPDTATRAKTHSKNPGNSLIFHYMKLIRSVPLIQIRALKDLSFLLKGTGLLRAKNRYGIQRGENHYQGNHSQDFALSRGHSLTLWARPTRQAWNLTRHTILIKGAEFHNSAPASACSFRDFGRWALQRQGPLPDQYWFFVGRPRKGTDQ